MTADVKIYAMCRSVSVSTLMIDTLWLKPSKWELRSSPACTDLASPLFDRIIDQCFAVMEVHKRSDDNPSSCGLRAAYFIACLYTNILLIQSTVHVTSTCVKKKKKKRKRSNTHRWRLEVRGTQNKANTLHKQKTKDLRSNMSWSSTKTKQNFLHFISNLLNQCQTG